MDIYTSNYQSPLGAIVTAAHDGAVVGLWFEKQKYFPKDTADWIFAPDYPVLTELRVWLDDYFNQTGSPPPLQAGALPESVGVQTPTDLRRSRFGYRARESEACEMTLTGGTPAIPFALAPVGSAFRQMVWRILLDIPYGCTTTYGAISKQIAAELGKDRFSAQAVGGAVGHNPISILIPCHRVVGSNGSLTGYAGGLDRKQALLELERIRS
jgi:methylated-DNA-[protein]-cysteine S-methyltransferase